MRRRGSQKGSRVATALATAVPETGPPPSGTPRRLVLFVCLMVLAVTGLLFARTAGHSFINYDDQIYVIDNTHASTGLTWENIGWAFRSGYAANWHPLTWLSHMLDCQLFGMNPGPHHLTSVALHSAVAVLLFLTLYQTTGFIGRSAFVALLFALHPTHVESVAWISERKDVLSACFWFASTLAYAHYAVQPTAARYAIVAGFFACGLMAKPMTVTLPCVLLLLDYWPLNRLRSLAQFWPRLLEKAPLFALAAIASAITYRVQEAGGAIASVGSETVLDRLGRVVLSYDFYLRKTFWPEGLIIPYWTEFTLNFSALATAGLMLVLPTLAVLRFGDCFRYLPVGWFWFLGTFVPVIGLVRVGSQSAADRYTYLPSVGLFILMTWLFADLFVRWRVPRAVSAAAGAVLLGACAILTHRQVGYWKNSITLFQHTLAVDEANVPAVDRLAWTYATDLDPTLRDGLKAQRLAAVGVQLTARRQPLFLNTLAAAHAELGQFDLALQLSEEALRLLGPGPSALGTEIKNNLQRYRAGRAIHR